MSDLAQREFDLYRTEDTAARAILDAAAEANRNTTPEEDERFDKLVESAKAHKDRADKLISMDQDAAAATDALRSLGLASIDTDNGVAPTKLTSDQQIMANIRSIVDAHKRGGNEPAELAFEGDVDLAVRAIADFSDNASLYTTEFINKVAVYQRTASPWINLATVFNADNGRPWQIPNLTADPTAYTPGEGTAITEATPTLGTAALTTTAYKELAYISQEAEEDELIGLLQLIAKVQGRAIGLKFGSDLTVSLLTAMTNGGTATGAGGGGGTSGTAVATFIGYEDLIDLKYGAAVPYRDAGVWVMSNGAIKKARKYRDGQGQYLWQPAIAQGQPATFDGNAVYEDPFLAAPASATKSVVFGDVSGVIIKQMALRVATSGDYRFNTDQIALKTVYRAGGALPDVLSLRYLVSANT